MRNVMLLTLNSLKITFRKKGTLIILFILPIVGILLAMGLYKGSGTRSAKIGILDYDKTTITQHMVDTIRNEENFKVLIVNKNEVNAKITDGYLDCALIIPKGFTTSLLTSSHSYDASIKSIKGYEVTAQIKIFVDYYIKNLSDIAMASGGDKSKFNQIYKNFSKGNLTLESKKLQDQSLNKIVTVQSIGFLLIFLMFTTGNTAEQILKEKRNRTFYRISSSPINTKTYIASNILTNLFIVLIQSSVVLFVLTAILQQKTFIPFYLLLFVLIIFGTVSIGIGMVIVSFSKDTLQTNTLSNLIITPSCMLGGCFWSIDLMPKYMQKIADFMPQKWALDTIRELQTGGSSSKILLNIVVLFAFATALFLIAAYRFRRNNDVRSVV